MANINSRIRIASFLTVVGFSRSERRGKHSTKLYWLCHCDCGKSCEVQGDNLRIGNTKSCGCQAGRRIAPSVPPSHYRSGERMSWRAMWQRCTNPSNNRFAYYGGRGIAVCDRWKDFCLFLADVGPRPTRRHSIDRIDVNGNYEPGNVRWATPIEQRRNRRDYIEAHPEEICQ